MQTLICDAVASLHAMGGGDHIATGAPAGEYGPSASPIRYGSVTVSSRTHTPPGGGRYGPGCHHWLWTV